ncbi:MarR family transcriptional regulator [Nonomuraea sp. PA05]|uniref:MarR family winged helix-turn-helix transcriptional regulator n=1 Tax=Nonomuraea sp. PA05 TaxID=2604466 RepID=UPI0011DA0808|nr:MarR family transcriptional regulator [Nonomuraea sp. PA05]TYB63329.1 MarR family transcriptional regulator [Nonomuraea sp. PA05]
MTAAPPVSDVASMWNHVLLLHARVESRLGTALQRRHGIGLSEYRALGHLAAAPRSELRMQELADRLGLNQSSVTRLVARLNTAEFTYRDLCPDDKRGVYTVITEAGRDRYAEASRTYEETLRAALGEAGQVDAALAAAVTSLGDSLANSGTTP